MLAQSSGNRFLSTPTAEYRTILDRWRAVLLPPIRLLVSLTKSVCFMRSSKVIFVLSAILFAFASFECSESSAQSSPRVYRTSPTAWGYVRSRSGSCDRSQFAQVAGNFPAFYAPQVPMGPMVAGVVPTMSAYYVCLLYTSDAADE